MSTASFTCRTNGPGVEGQGRRRRQAGMMGKGGYDDELRRGSRLVRPPAYLTFENEALDVHVLDLDVA